MERASTRDEMIVRYEHSHQHPVNRVCHTIGIPLIALSLLLGLLSIGIRPLLKPAIVLFVLGWLLQFVGHAFERKRPEFFNDWRFLLVGFRWWLMKISGRV